MWKEFKAFLLKENALALAIAVVIGAALQKLVTAFVQDFMMPIISALTPSGSWREIVTQIGPVKFLVGDLLGTLLDFIIVAFVVWRMSKLFVRQKPSDPGRNCPFCRQMIDKEATRCPHCTSQLAAMPA
jgi:large conductance mechanosensitive channel